MQHTSDQNNYVVQTLLAVLATVLAIVCWFQVYG
jgi:hypothetical protein